MVIDIPDERAPGWNSTLRVHWSERAKLVQSIWWAAMVGFDDEPAMFDCPVDVHITAVFKGQALDSDNICAKLYIDALKGRILQDDSPTWIRRVTTESVRGKENSVRIELREAK